MAKRNYHLSLRGTVGGYDFDSGYVDYKLAKHKDEQVSVLIDSLGGSVATALSISSAFHNHGNVAVHLRSLCASAATIASMGAARITMEPSAMYLVHRCSALVVEWASLNADQLAERIEQLKKQQIDLAKIDENIAAMYARRCKKPAADLLALMQRGGWLNAEETLAWGFIDEIAETEDAAKPVLTDSIASALAAEGIPIPNLPVADKETAFGRFIAALQSFFAPKQDNNQTTLTTMETPLICAAASIAAPTADESGNVTLAATVIEAVENHIADLNGTVSTLTAERDRLQADLAAARQQIATLQAQPGAQPNNVVNTATGQQPTVKPAMKELMEAQAAAMATVNSWQ